MRRHKQELLRIQDEHEKDIQRLHKLHQQQISSLGTCITGTN